MKNIFIAVSFIPLIFGCSQTIENEEHLHNAKLQLAAYSDKFEVFAEADPLIIGKTSKILAHFTRLDDFKPLEEGEVTLSLITGKKGIRQKIVKASQRGIYVFNIQPEKAGAGKIQFTILTKHGESYTINDSVRVYTEEHEALQMAEKMEITSSNAVVFTKEQSWKVEFATEFPVIEEFGHWIKSTAMVQTLPMDKIVVSAKINGMLQFSRVDILNGIEVEKGQEIMSISGNDLLTGNSELRYKEAENNFKKSQSEYERLLELAKNQIVAEKDLMQSKIEFDNAKAIFDNLKQNFSINGQKVTCPASGFIQKVFVQNGQYIEPGTPLFEIAQNKKLLLSAEIQAKYAPMLASVYSATIRNDYNHTTYTLEQLGGKILSYGKSTDRDNFLIPFHFQIVNDGSFVPGTFVEVFLKAKENKKSLTIPLTALLEEQGNYFVYVQLTPELFEKREVKITGSNLIKAEVTHGISLHERIVSRGAVWVKLAQSAGALDAHSGHVH